MNIIKKLSIIGLLLVLILSGCNKPEPQQDLQQTAQEEEARKKEEEEKRKREEEQKRLDEEEKKRLEEEEKNRPRSVLSGVVIDQPIENRVLAVMIDNQYDARMQAGLSKAEIIYEIDVESDITRYMALFLKDLPERVGPIRSARPYFVNIAMEYDAILTRFGGSTDADQDIVDFGLDQIDGMVYEGVYIVRDHTTGKFAPHDAYTSLPAIRQAEEDLGMEKRPPESDLLFHYREETPMGSDATAVHLVYNEFNSTSYEFVDADQNYRRYKDGQPHIDENDGTEIRAKNILVQLTDSGLMENGIHKWIETVGEGTGYYISNGKAINIHWQKESREAKTQFTTENGEPLLLNPGQTWIQIMNVYDDISWE